MHHLNHVQVNWLSVSPHSEHSIHHYLCTHITTLTTSLILPPSPSLTLPPSPYLPPSLHPSPYLPLPPSPYLPHPTSVRTSATFWLSLVRRDVPATCSRVSRSISRLTFTSSSTCHTSHTSHCHYHRPQHTHTQCLILCLVQTFSNNPWVESLTQNTDTLYNCQWVWQWVWSHLRYVKVCLL